MSSAIAQLSLREVPEPPLSSDGDTISSGDISAVEASTHSKRAQKPGKAILIPLPKLFTHQKELNW